MPFSGFDDFNDCLKKNKKKYGKNASKICGAIKNKVEGKKKK
jgi:hypothetical protein